MGKRCRETGSCPKLHPSTATHNRAGSHRSRASPWGVRVLFPTWGTPNLGACTGEMRPPKCLALKINGLMPMGPRGLWESEILLLKGICVALLIPAWAQRQQFERWLDNIWRFICHSQNICQRGRDHEGFFGDRATCEHRFCTLPPPC